MSTDLVIYSNSTLEQRKNYAQTLANAGDLIPKGLFAPARPNPEGGVFPAAPSPGKVLLVMETGAMLGLHPVAALQGVHIIEGKATLSPALMSAVIRKAGHKLRVTTTGSIAAGDFAATATLVRSDDPDFTYSATWTMDRAKRAGLDKKDVWQKYGEAMCKARAISEVCREGGEDALMGVHYTPEELDVGVSEDGAADVVDAELEPSEDWPLLVEKATTKDQLLDIAKRATEASEYPDTLRTQVLTKIGALSRLVGSEDAPSASETDAEHTDRLAQEGAAAGIHLAEVITAHTEDDEPTTKPERDPAEPSAEEWAAQKAQEERATAAETADITATATEAEGVAYEAYRTDGGSAPFAQWLRETRAAQQKRVEEAELARWQAAQVKP